MNSLVALVVAKVLTVKVVFCGEGGVGKSSLIMRFLTGEFHKHMKLTPGFRFYERNIDVDDDIKVKLIYWDLGGQEQFSYYTQNSKLLNKAMVTIFVFDTHRIPTVKSLYKWREIEPLSKAPIKILVGNKIDLLEDPQSMSEYIRDIASELKAKKYFLTSAADGRGVSELFKYIDECVINLIRSAILRLKGELSR